MPTKASAYPSRMTRAVAVLLGAPVCAEAQTRPALAPSTRPAAVTDATVDAVLRSHPTYQSLRQTVDKLDAEIAGSRMGPRHFRLVRLRAVREAYQSKLEKVRAEVATQIAADPSRFATGSLGLVLAKAPPSATAALNLPRGAGLVVDGVLPKTAGAVADVMPGDILHRLDGQLLVNPEQFEVLAGSYAAPREAALELFRDGASLKRTVRVGG